MYLRIKKKFIDVFETYLNCFLSVKGNILIKKKKNQKVTKEYTRGIQKEAK